jgi:hypothetical protein
MIDPWSGEEPYYSWSANGKRLNSQVSGRLTGREIAVDYSSRIFRAMRQLAVDSAWVLCKHGLNVR